MKDFLLTHLSQETQYFVFPLHSYAKKCCVPMMLKKTYFFMLHFGKKKKLSRNLLLISFKYFLYLCIASYIDMFENFLVGYFDKKFLVYFKFILFIWKNKFQFVKLKYFFSKIMLLPGSCSAGTHVQFAIFSYIFIFCLFDCIIFLCRM